MYADCIARPSRPPDHNHPYLSLYTPKFSSRNYPHHHNKCGNVCPGGPHASIIVCRFCRSVLTVSPNNLFWDVLRHIRTECWALSALGADAHGKIVGIFEEADKVDPYHEDRANSISSKSQKRKVNDQHDEWPAKRSSPPNAPRADRHTSRPQLNGGNGLPPWRGQKSEPCSPPASSSIASPQSLEEQTWTATSGELAVNMLCFHPNLIFAHSDLRPATVGVQADNGWPSHITAACSGSNPKTYSIKAAASKASSVHTSRLPSPVSPVNQLATQKHETSSDTHDSPSTKPGAKLSDSRSAPTAATTAQISEGDNISIIKRSPGSEGVYKSSVFHPRIFGTWQD